MYQWFSQPNVCENVPEGLMRRSEVDFHFLLFLIEDNASYQKLFSEWKNVVPCIAKVIAFSNRENAYNYIARANFNRDSLTLKNLKNYLQLKNYLLLHFLR